MHGCGPHQRGLPALASRQRRVCCIVVHRCSIPFEKLTALADKLLAAGDFDVYSNTREVLLRQAQAALGVEVARQVGERPAATAAGAHALGAGEGGPAGVSGRER